MGPLSLGLGLFWNSTLNKAKQQQQQQATSVTLEFETNNQAMGQHKGVAQFNQLWPQSKPQYASFLPLTYFE